MAAVSHPAPIPFVGSLVSVRGRDWIVLLPPLTGGGSDVIAILLSLEARFFLIAHTVRKKGHKPDPGFIGLAATRLKEVQEHYARDRRNAPPPIRRTRARIQPYTLG